MVQYDKNENIMKDGGIEKSSSLFRGREWCHVINDIICDTWEIRGVVSEI